jgi:hypothetical protein
LGDILNKHIPDKKEFIEICNEIGPLVVDISPFPLNSKDTKINYRKSENGSKKLSKKQYQQLVELTIPTFFELKVKAVAKKKSANIRTFFRYTRVKITLKTLFQKCLLTIKLSEYKMILATFPKMVAV